MDDSSRRTAHEIFEKVEASAHDELRRSSRALAFSGIAGGLGMGLTGLAVASVLHIIGDGPTQKLIALLWYPIGFISVVIGRAQLFTENTLYPVALILSEHKHVVDTLRLWAVVFISNIIGAALFATVAMKTGALTPGLGHKLAELGIQAATGEPSYFFWSGVLGGWIIALMAWTVTGSHWTIGQIAVVWLLTVVVGLGHFSHCIASSGEILSAVVTSQVAFTQYLKWLVCATSGNILGGVTFVTVLNFGQVKEAL